jgi:hypothetical protein
MSSLFSLASATVGGGHRNRAGYRIDRSVRLRSSAQGYFSKTLTTPTNNKKWTYSVWMKRGSLSANRTIMSSNVDGAEYWDMRFNTSDQILIQNRVGSSNLLFANTTAVYRDPSAWYHIVFVFDSDNATDANRNLLYVNGVNVSLSANSGSGNASAWNTSGVQHNIGVSRTLTTGGGIWAEFDGYETEVNFIDGQALTPPSFGETDVLTGVWKPKKYTGTYGTNGFYLNFSDNSAANAEAIGKDYSGNGNNWTPNNISVTAGVTYDSMLDVPTLWADGGNGRGNYWTFNPLIPVAGATYSNGNLQYTNSGNNKSGFSSPLPNTGKWYWEGTWITSGSGSSPIIGLAQAGFENTQGATGELGYRANGNKFDQAATETAYGSTWTTGDVIGVAVDMDAGTIAFYKNGTSQGTAFTTVLTALTQPVSPVFRVNVAGDVFAFNFGQRPFAYTPPTGFKALNTLNLPEPTILKGNQYFDATTYTGQSTSLSVTNPGSMQPDFVWIKKRNGATDHNLTDAVRGTNRNLISNSTAAEDTVARLTSFNSNGFTLAGAFDNTNLSGSTYVGWQWKANGAGVSNPAGTITSTVSVSATSGFSIVSYTGNAISGATVGHGLGVTPAMVIIKSRSVTTNFYVWHRGLTQPNYQLYLNLTSAQDTAVLTFLNDKAPTSTLFELPPTGYGSNNSGATYVAYCFSEVAGFSKFGSYTGNGSADGPFVFCGFRPRFVMWKNASAAEAWLIEDTARSTYNQVALELYPSSSGAEAAGSSRSPTQQFDFLSNGFKVRGAQEQTNGNGNTIIFAAFAEHPFKNALAR